MPQDGGRPDGGAPGSPDASLPHDAGALPDAGPPDASGPMPNQYYDGGIYDGGGPRFDGGLPFDAGSAMVFDGGIFDGNAPQIDTGNGSPMDAGSPEGDAGPEVGGPCTTTSSCRAGVDPVCLQSTGGYCSSSCTMNLDCGPGGTCVPNYLPVATSGSVPQNACFHICATTADCRNGYVCMPDALPDACGDDCAQAGVCVPRCADDSDCSGGLSCDTATGFCQGPIGSVCGDIGNCSVPNPVCMAGPGGYCTTFCTSDGDCGAGANCVPNLLPGFLNDGGALGGCLADCSTASDCRTGYICAQGPDASSKGCSVGCTSDAECSSGTCDQSTGYCTGPDAGMMMMCPPPDSSCGTVAQAGSSVTLQLVSGSAPAATGGTITAGTYALTSYLQYTGAGGASGMGMQTMQSTAVITGSASPYGLQKSTATSACPATTNGAKLATSGTQLTVTPTCPPCNGVTCDQSGSYSVSGSTLTLFLQDAQTSASIAEVFTLQGQ